MISRTKCALIIVLLLMNYAVNAQAQLIKPFADSIRQLYKIPELGYAVVSRDSVLELDVAGVKKWGTDIAAEKSDLFRIGSNTKAITGFIAAMLVKDKKIAWNTRFFDLFPELKAGSRKEYQDLTLMNLLSFRARLFPYTYTNDTPVKGQFTGNEDEQLYQFAQWFFKHKPVARNGEVHFSNLGYVAAALMIEKASGKTYKQLVADLGNKLDIHFEFGQPNTINDVQPWGHNGDMVPEPPGDNYKLNWLLPAGNICVSLPDYVKFIQLQLKGLAGKSELLTKEEFQFLHFGLNRFSVGWFSDTDAQGHNFSHNTGNPGSFLTSVYVYPDTDRAFILFSNAQTDATAEGLDILYEEMKRQYTKDR